MALLLAYEMGVVIEGLSEPMDEGYGSDFRMIGQFGPASGQSFSDFIDDHLQNRL